MFQFFQYTQVWLWYSQIFQQKVGLYALLDVCEWLSIELENLNGA